MRRAWPAILIVLLSCKSEPAHDHHGEEDHAHEKAHAEGEAHEHGSDLPTQSATVWTERTELFVEFSPLIAGEESKFAVHLTRLSDFRPLTSGVVTVRLKPAGGAALEARVEKPSSPGIFGPALRPVAAGECELAVVIEGPDADTIPFGPCRIFDSNEDAFLELDEEEEPPGRISFLKEQQWKTEFSTVEIPERTLQPSVSASGEIRPAAGKEARLGAATSGRVQLELPAAVIGSKVAAGQVLATIAPRLSAGGDRATLDAEALAARAELEAAEAQVSRSERLFAERATPERALEEAKTRQRVARARLDAAQARLAQYSAGASGKSGRTPGAFQVRSPIEGTLVFASPTSGESVEEGAHLFTVIDLDEVWLEAKVFEPDIPKIEDSHSAWFTIQGYEKPFSVDQSNGKRISVGQVIDPRSRTASVIFEVANPEGRLRIGQSARVHIAAGAPITAPAVPEESIVDENGRPAVFVQLDGESFERRLLRIGVRDRGWAAVLEGVSTGERVVVRGAYDLKLSAASGAIPAHGHAH